MLGSQRSGNGAHCVGAAASTRVHNGTHLRCYESLLPHHEVSMRLKAAMYAGLLLSAPGCYHAIVETGLPASTEVIAKPWASGWIYGLVPPSPISAASQCKSGVAKVETVHSFANQLVGILTFGIYTPMDIRVTCASARAQAPGAGPAQFGLNGDAPLKDYQAVFGAAAEAAVTSGAPTFVIFIPTR